jgi:hypothetical protein
MSHARKALAAYKEEKLNCAQSVLRAFQDELSIPEERIAAFKAFGGGRAEEGLCGALYAALELAQGAERKASLRRRFSEKAGAVACKALKGELKFPCADCVELAAKLLEEESR